MILNLLRKRQGFTLVELLVVVAIIAVLVALLIPGILQAKQQAISSVCLSNLKSNGVVFREYANDSGGIIPEGNSNYNMNAIGWLQFYNGNSSGPAGTVPNATKYVAMANNGYTSKTLFCPNNASSTASTYLVIPGGSNISGEFKSAWVINTLSPFSANYFYGLKIGDVYDAANIVTLIDGAEIGGGTGGLPITSLPPTGGRCFGTGSQANFGGQKGGAWMAHPDHINALFVDGHAESCNKGTLLSSIDNPNSSPFAGSRKMGITWWWNALGAVPPLTSGGYQGWP